MVAAAIEAVLGLLGAFGAVLAAIVSIIAAFLLQAALVKAVEDVRDGRVDLSFGETLQAARPAVGRVAVASILAGFAIGIGLLLCIVPGLWLLTIWCLIVPVIVLERAGIGEAFGRSRDLVRGHGWQVLGTIVLVFLVLLAVSLVVGLLLAAFPRAARTSSAASCPARSSRRSWRWSSPWATSGCSPQSRRTGRSLGWAPGRLSRLTGQALASAGRPRSPRRRTSAARGPALAHRAVPVPVRRCRP